MTDRLCMNNKPDYMAKSTCVQVPVWISFQPLRHLFQLGWILFWTVCICFNLSVFHTNLSALHTNLSAFQYGCMHAFFPRWTNNIRTVNKYCVCVSLFPFSCYNIEYSPRCQGTQPGILSEHWHPLLERNWGKSHLQHHTLCSYT